jgi:hypothetical protein
MKNQPTPAAEMVLAPRAPQPDLHAPADEWLLTNLAKASEALRSYGSMRLAADVDEARAMLAAAPAASEQAAQVQEPTARTIEDCPELNLSNYDAEDVAQLNDWAVRADAEIDRLASKPLGDSLHPVMQHALAPFLHLAAALPPAAPAPLPPELVAHAEKYDDVLVPFLTLMRRELHANCGKGDRPGWLAMSANEGLLEVYYHLSKLQKAVKHNDGPAIQEFSADVANMAMMVLDICGGLAWVDAVAAPASPANDDQINVALNAPVACGESVRWYLEQAFTNDESQVRDIMVREIVRVILAASAAPLPDLHAAISDEQIKRGLDAYWACMGGIEPEVTDAVVAAIRAAAELVAAHPSVLPAVVAQEVERDALMACRNALLAAGVGRVSQMARDAIDAATAILGDGAPDA